ncbi:MAG: baseplate J/gp47 family protein [Acetobacter sp.]
MSDSSFIGTTSVPAPTLSDTGFVAPARSDILAGALADLNAAFGNVLNTDLSTPQGQLATSFTAALGDCYDQMLALFNGVDPARASGRMQDAIGNLYFLSRKGATATVVTVVCTGAAGTVVPQGTLVQDTSGQSYAADGAVVLDGTGTGVGTFSCTQTGPVVCPAQTVGVYQSVPGLTSVTNPAAGVTGVAQESRVAFEKRRAASVAANALGSLNAIAGAVQGVDGVSAAYVADNSTAEPVTVGGVSLAARSLYVCVNGGTDTDVALAILSRKPPGCGYTGTTSVTVSDPNSTYSTPPRYTVSFTRAVATPVFFAVTLKNSAAVPSTAARDVQAAIVAAFATDPNATIGGTVFASSYYAAVAALGGWAQIIEITTGTVANPAGFTASLTIGQIPTLEAAAIAVTLS